MSQNLQNLELIANAKGQKVVRVSSRVFELERLISTLRGAVSWRFRGFALC